MNNNNSIFIFNLIIYPLITDLNYTEKGKYLSFYNRILTIESRIWEYAILNFKNIIWLENVNYSKINIKKIENKVKYE